jgi:hypothetical protein
MEGDWYRQAIPGAMPWGSPRPGDSWSPERREPEEWMRSGRYDDWDRREPGWDQARGQWPRGRREEFGGRPESWTRPRGDESRGGYDGSREHQGAWSREHDRNWRGGQDRWDEGSHWPQTSRPEWGGGRQYASNYGREDFGGYGREGDRRETPAWGGMASGGHRGKGPKNYSRSDDRIREEVNERLTDHPDVDATEIDVQVKDGEVTLSGTVDERRTKRMAEECAEQVWGVKEVHNQIRVAQTQPQP